MKCNIQCQAIHAAGEREWEITSEGRMWPCCYFANAWDKKLNIGNGESDRLLADKRFKKLMDQDSNWNNLDHHTIDEISQHEFYNDYIWYPGWENGNTSSICVKECTVYSDPVTGVERTASTNDLSRLTT